MPSPNDPLIIHYRRAAARAAARRRGLPRTPRPQRPTGVERRYLRNLMPIVNLAKQAVDAILVPALPALLKRTRGDARQDDAALDIGKLIESVQAYFYRRYSKAEAEQLAAKFAQDTRNFTADQIQAQFRRVLGVDALTTSPAVAQEVALATTENVALITTIPAQYFDKVQAQVWDGVRRGLTEAELGAQLADTYDITERRAAFIARDQTSKLNGVLTEVTHKSLGITGYIWRTAGDARVRDTHAELDGESFDYDSPPDTGDGPHNPGIDFNCRCYAEPDFSGLLDYDEPSE